MKFLADQDVYATTVLFLKGLGHEVVTATELGMEEADDMRLLQEAHSQERIFVTRDRDFGGIVYVQGEHRGVIYLRILPTTLISVHTELGRVISLYDEQRLQKSFVVVEPARHRIRNLGDP